MDWDDQDSDDESVMSPDSEDKTFSDSERVNNSSNVTYPFRPQKELKYNHLLPYSDQIAGEAVDLLTEIKTNIAKGLLLSDPRFFLWVTQLSKYIRLYGRLFSKEDHIFFIQVLLKVIQLDISGSRLSFCCSVLTTLLKKRELLSRDDLQIDWRPLYQLYERSIHKSTVNFYVVTGLEDNLKGVIRAARVYFPIRDTQDILDEFNPYLCPYDKFMSRGLFYLANFLPTVTSNPAEHEMGYKLWFEQFMTIWDANPNSPEWEQHLVNLFARLAHDTIGLIDWSPWIPKIFTHLMRSFDLQNGAHKVQIRRNYNVFDMNSVVLWIISMLGGKEGEITLSHIEMMFKSLESYYYPSNVGRWNTKLSQLLSKLPHAFVRRLHRERFKKKTWEPTVPDSHKISEEIITRFTECLIPVIDVAMFSPRGTNDASLAMQHLSSVRPNLILTPLLDKMYRSFETLTEPHRLISCIWCAIRVARSLVMGGKDFPEGPSHAIRLLMELLPGIDPNDIKKSTMTFQFVSAVSSLITFVDCSAAIDVRNDLTPEEYNLCLASTQLESFVLQYFDRCFALIESSSFEHPVERTGSDQNHFSSQEMVVELGISSTLAGLILHSSPSIVDKAIDKLFAFIENRIFETKVAGKFVAAVVFAIVKGCPEKVRNRFIPHFHRLIMNLTSEEHQHESGDRQHQTDEQLVFALQVMVDVVKGVRPGLVDHQKSIVEVLERTLHHRQREVSTLSASLLRNTITTLATPSIKQRDDRLDLEDFTKYLPIRDWGCTLELDEIRPTFYVPTDEDVSFSQLLIHKFLEGELQYLDNWINGSLMEPPTREEINRSLNIVFNAFRGGVRAFEYWEATDKINPDQGQDSLVQLPDWRVRSIGNKPITLSDGSNVRQTVAQQIRKVLKYIMVNSEDDVKSLRAISEILHDVMFHFGVKNGEFNSRWKAFTLVRSSVENKLLGSRKHTRIVLLERITLQQELRENQKTITPFTKLHQEIMIDLITMAVSHYSEVRRKAQEVVTVYLHYFPLHVEFIVDLLLPCLQKGADGHEAFKGALYMLLGESGMKSFLTVNDWRLRKNIWLGIVDSHHSEKPSITRLLTSGIDFFCTHFDPLDMYFGVTEEVMDVAKQAWTRGIMPKEESVSDDDIMCGLMIQQKEKQQNEMHHRETTIKLSILAEDVSRHWHLKHLAYGLLMHLYRTDVVFPTEAVSVFAKNLINDSLMIRKFCFSSLPNILKTQKRPHTKKVIEPKDRQSNAWLTYDPTIDYTREDIWKSTDFVFKTYIGFYAYPKDGIKVTDYDNEPKVSRTREELLPEEVPVFDFFMDQEKVDQLLTYFSLEEKKGSDKFSSNRFLFWKTIFRSYGPIFLSVFEKKITDFVKSSQESQQRCAAEFLAGLFRGSRRWTYEQHMTLKEFAAPLVKSMFQSIIPETLTDWGTCCATIFEREDGRRISWFVEMVMDDPLNVKLFLNEKIEEEEESKMILGLPVPPKETSTSTSFIHSSRIYCLMGVLQQQQWKVLKVLQNLTNYLKEGPHLTQSFQIVRQRIGVLLANIFTFDVAVPCLPGTLDNAPRRDDFVAFVLPQLNPLMTEEPNSLNTINGITGELEQSPEKKAASNVIKTVCQWMVQNFTKNSCSTSTGLFELLPFICQTQTETTDEELMREAKSAFLVFSHTMLTTEGVECALKKVKEIIASKSWRTRVAGTTYLQYMAMTNLFKLRSKQAYVDQMKEIVLTIMEDERIEVREAGATIFGGLIHCHFLPLNASLKKLLIAKSNHVVKKIRNPANPLQISVDSADLVVRHSGVLGLCCIVNAYPYEVPTFLPKILMLLSSHLNDPAPIPATIKKTMNSFKRTHQDNWSVHKEKFTEDELAELTDILVSPTYYA